MSAPGPSGAYADLRQFMAALDAGGALRSVRDDVDPRFELAAYLAALDGGPAVRFDAVRGHSMPVVGNVYGTRARLAQAIGVPPQRLHDHVVAALDSPLPPVAVEVAPCHEVVVDNPDLARHLPVPRFFEHETGPYITAGAIVARDPRNDAANLSIARLKLLGGNRAMVGIAPNHHLAVFARAARERGERLPIAVCVGVPPAVLLAACLYLARGQDEMAYAGALAGAPIAAVTTSTGLTVPAAAEVVLEAELDPEETVAEGLVSEFHGMYEDYGVAPVATVTRLTHRSDAVFQVIEPGYHAEHALLGAVAIEAGLTHQLRSRLPAVRSVRIASEGGGRLGAVVTLGPHRPGEAQRVAFGVCSAVSLVKTVIVADEDVDPDDGSAVVHALLTRVRAERDVLVVPGGPADRAEPIEQAGTVARTFVDATRHPGDRDWRPAQPPAAVIDALRARLGDA